MNFCSEIRLCKKVNPKFTEKSIGTIQCMFLNFYAPNGQTRETRNVKLKCPLHHVWVLKKLITVEGY